MTHSSDGSIGWASLTSKRCSIAFNLLTSHGIFLRGTTRTGYLDLVSAQRGRDLIRHKFQGNVGRCILWIRAGS